MKNKRISSLRIGCAGLALLALSACGGGGSTGTTSVPKPPAGPDTSTGSGSGGNAEKPGASSKTTDYDTTEYRRSEGAVGHNALTAWQAGRSGENVAIAVIDSGIDADSPEFAGRVHEKSQDIAGDRGIDNANDSHGTHVAMIAGAARNGTGIVGIAWNAKIMALRTDSPGSCQGAAGCSFSDVHIAAAVDKAVAANAKIINISLGGGAPAPDLRRAVADAAKAGAVVIVAAGNQGASKGPGVDPNSPSEFASGLLKSGSGNVIIVGSVDENNTLSSFSNRAGFAQYGYITARGERLCCEYKDGVLREEEQDGKRMIWKLSGTSYAAPQVAGAAALLAQAFPKLTGKQIVELLLLSARDAGETGLDKVYGHGILDIAAAFAPRGQTSLAGTSTSYEPAAQAGQTSAPMGDALTGVSLPTVMTDSYNRAYNVDMAQGLQSAAIADTLTPAITSHSRERRANAGPVALAFSIAPQPYSSSQADNARGADRHQHSAYGLAPIELAAKDADQARVLAARATVALSRDTELALAMGINSSNLISQLQRSARGSFLLGSDDGIASAFTQSQGKLALAMRRKMGAWGLSFAAESAEVQNAAQNAVGQSWQNTNLTDFGSKAHRFSIGLDRNFGPVHGGLTLSVMNETRSILGARLGGAWGNPGATSLIADFAAAWQFAPRWNIAGRWQRAQSRVERTGLIQSGSQMASASWSLDIERRGVLGSEDSLALRLSQPLRVSGGGIALNLPKAYDYGSQAATFGRSFLSLAPTGREQRAELRWTSTIFGGAAGASLFWRQEPGHYQNASDDAGLAVEWQREF